MNKVESFWQAGKGRRDLEKEIQEGQEEFFDNEEENIPFGLVNAQDFGKTKEAEDIDKIYDWYSRAISRRGREPLSKESFCYHFFEGGSAEENYLFGNQEQGYLLGIFRQGVFMPTHFSPRSMKGGYMLIKELGGNEEIPSIMAITEDLKNTLKKMPEWNDSGLTFPSLFRSEIQDKFVFYNSHPDIKSLLPIVINGYLKEK